jgi:type II secretory pathway component GspD/PulD (secretin)
MRAVRQSPLQRHRPRHQLPRPLRGRRLRVRQAKARQRLWFPIWLKYMPMKYLNAIIILGTPEDYEVIKETIAKLDIVPRQVLIEGEIASIQLTDKMSLGLAWSLQTNGLNMNPVTISLQPLCIKQ